MFEIETRKPNDSLLSEWTSEIGDANQFATRQDAWEMIGDLKKLDEEWETAEYRVVNTSSSKY
jgi:hypothetical protein